MSGSLALSSVCAKCFQPVSSSSGGFILSCSDFLCLRCSNNGRTTGCPACGKQQVQLLNLSGALPDEVSENLVDPAQRLELTTNAVKFQIKYYKQTIKKLLTRNGQLGKENQQLKQTLTMFQRQQNSSELMQQPAPISPNASSFFQDSAPPPTARPSMNQVLTNPITPTTLPASQRRPETPFVTSGESLLTKRPASSFPTTQNGSGATRSLHFPTATTTPSTPAPAKRPQWSLPPQSRPTSALMPSDDARTQGIAARPETTAPPPVQQQGRAAPTVQWGFGLPPATPAVPGTPAMMSAEGSQRTSTALTSSTRPHTTANITPSSSLRPPSAQRPPTFVTPSRLRSPHPQPVRTGSGGPGRTGSGGTASAATAAAQRKANPMQGIGVTLSLSQVGGQQNSLQGFLAAAHGGDKGALYN